MGCSPFIGAGQFGARASEYYRKFYVQPENMVRLFLKSFELGVASIQLIEDRPLEALIEASYRSGVKPYIVYSTHLSGEALRTTLDRLKQLEPEIIAIHAEVVDQLDIGRVMERMDIVREYGASLGLATHRPGVTLRWVEREDVPVDVILTPLNRLGYAMEPDFASSLEAIKACTRKILAIKPLAAGSLRPGDAFTFIYKYADSAAVGVTSEFEMRETYEAALEAHNHGE